MALPADRWRIGTRYLRYVCGITTNWQEKDWLNLALAHARRNPDHRYVDNAPNAVTRSVTTLRALRKATS